jgi:hypothetical protein
MQVNLCLDLCTERAGISVTFMVGVSLDIKETGFVAVD